MYRQVPAGGTCCWHPLNRVRPTRPFTGPVTSRVIIRRLSVHKCYCVLLSPARASRSEIRSINVYGARVVVVVVVVCRVRRPKIRPAYLTRVGNRNVFSVVRATGNNFHAYGDRIYLAQIFVSRTKGTKDTYLFRRYIFTDEISIFGTNRFRRADPNGNDHRRSSSLYGDVARRSLQNSHRPRPRRVRLKLAAN